MNIKNIRSRLGSSMVIVVGIGGVVAVLVVLLAMAEGFRSTMQGMGFDDRVIILRSGSNSEINGSITFDQANIISHKSGIQQSSEGPLVAGESYVSINVSKFSNNSSANVPLRGISKMSFHVRPEISILAGRKIEFGKFEVMVGSGAVSQFQGLEIGNILRLRKIDWKVVGIFDSGGSVYDSEVWTDALILNSAFGRGSTYSSLAARLSSSQDFDLLKNALTNDPRLTTKIQRESDFYGAQSEVTNQLIIGVGIVIGSIMAVGAIFAVLNTMYAAVSVRSVEIATLRALGFGQVPIVVSVIVESIVLAFIGAVLAGCLSYLLFNGLTTSTMGNNTQVSFKFMMTSEHLISGMMIALTLGTIGGLFPSIAAARLQITTALRGD